MKEGTKSAEMIATASRTKREQDKEVEKANEEESNLNEEVEGKNVKT